MTRTTRSRLAAVAAALFLLGSGLFFVSRSRTFQLFGEIVPRVETSRHVVALTFDDGPTDEALDALLPVLRERGVKATFFLIGEELAKHPDAGRRIAAEGHEIGNHSYSHQRMIFTSVARVQSEIERTDQLIADTGYRGPIHFRPPFCKKLFSLPWYLARNHRKTITWDLEPDSEPHPDTAQIVAHVVERARPGSIILLHVMYPGRAASLAAVGGAIDGLRKEGYSFETVSQLMGERPR